MPVIPDLHPHHGDTVEIPVNGCWEPYEVMRDDGTVLVVRSTRFTDVWRQLDLRERWRWPPSSVKARGAILAEFDAELDRANAKFPNEQRLPDGTGGGGRKTWETAARISCDRAHREGRLTHTHVFDEETAEVMAATDPAELRKELIQVGAMTLKWLLDLDSRKPI